VFRRLARTIGLVVPLVLAMVPVVASAQTNIDQGKSPAEIFANDCATCHKSPRGLANGKNSLMLSGFLREHYTASRDQAAALAAYVLGAGGGDSGTAAQTHSPKPGPDHAKATVDEPKIVEPKTTASKPTEPKPTEPKTAARPTHQPGDEDATPDDQGSPVAEPAPSVSGQRPGVGGHDVRPVTATRGHKKGQETAPSAQEPAAIIAAPSSNPLPSSGEMQNSTGSGSAAPSSAEAPSQDMSPTTSAAVPADSQPSDNAPVPRDKIPD
jgi:hypothetical protein